MAAIGIPLDSSRRDEDDHTIKFPPSDESLGHDQMPLRGSGGT